MFNSESYINCKLILNVSPETENKIVTACISPVQYCIRGLKFEQTLGDSEGQESLVCSSPWGDKESDTT